MNTPHPLTMQLELAKEVRYTFEGIEPKYIARIYKSLKGGKAQYQWDSNYYYRLKDQAMPYVTSNIFGSTLEKTEHRMEQYVKNFEKASGWVENDYF